MASAANGNCWGRLVSCQSIYEHHTILQDTVLVLWPQEEFCRQFVLSTPSTNRWQCESLAY